MATHQDADALNAMCAKAKLLTEKGLNKITAGELHGEKVLGEVDSSGFKIKKLPADPIGIRISIGKASSPLAQMVDDAHYLVFRGRLSEVLALLRDAVKALSTAPQEDLTGD